VNCSETNTPEAVHKYHLFAGGNEAAFSWLVARFRPALASAAWYYVRDHYAVSAILQEVYLKAWEFRHRISSYCHLFRFMRLCVKWKSLSWLRSSRRAVYCNYIDSVILENHRMASCNPFEDAEPTLQKEKWQQISKAMECLPGRRQTLMQLRFYEGLSAAKIARRMHVPATHVREEIKESINWLKQAIHSPNGWMVTSSQQQIELVTTGDELIDRVFTLRKQHKLSFAQIAEQLNLSQSTVLQHYLAANNLATHSKNKAA
jgi:RNA polymerase sigma factor (sigma-70 family)